MGTKQIVTLDKVVIALCQDYGRRAELISSNNASRRVDIECRYMNFKIYDAVGEISGVEKHIPIYIEEIGSSIGYAQSRLSFLSETTYKQYKRLMKDNIARKLHLCD